MLAKNIPDLYWQRKLPKITIAKIRYGRKAIA